MRDILSKRRHRTIKAAAALGMALAMAATSGCGGGTEAGNYREEAGGGQLSQQQQHEQLRMLSEDAVVKIERIGDIAFTDAAKLARLIGFRTEWTQDGRELKIGDNDVAIQLRSDNRQANEAGEVIEMEAAAVCPAEGKMLIPLSAAQRLFADEAVLSMDDETIAVIPRPQQHLQASDKIGNDVAGKKANEAQEGRPQAQSNGFRALVANDEANAIIADARKYLGVPYEFGADDYASSKRFDCSSFVRFLYGKYGYSLGRTAREQAKEGDTVPRSQLQPGDLMYFSVPGRFKSDDQVGHVSIYMGNQKMIHSSPLPEDGVQITDTEKEHWKNTFLFAKRLKK